MYPVFRQTLCLLFLSHSRAATQVARSVLPRRITGAWRWRHPLWKPSRRLKIARNPRSRHRSLDGSKKQQKASSFFGQPRFSEMFWTWKKRFRTANLFSANTSIIIPITIKSETQRHWDIGQDLGTLHHSYEAWMVIRHPYSSWFHISFGPTPYVPSYMGLMEYGHHTITKWIPKK